MALIQDDIVQALLAHRPKFLAASLAILRDVHSAEDVYQDMLMKALRHDGEFESTDHLLAWGWTVARNRARELLRKRHSHAAALNDEVLKLIVEETRERAANTIALRSEALSHCLGQLTENSQQIVKMRYVDGMKAVDVAQQLGRKVNAVYVSLSRIYRTLAECIERRLAEEGTGG